MSLTKLTAIIVGLLLVAALSGGGGLLYQSRAAQKAGAEGNKVSEQNKVPITFSGGHDTGPRDHGRPVVLVAAALGVKPEVFREAFRGVTPARNGPPSAQEARRNKAALMKVLAPYGVTNERLDEVSDYFRYQPQRGQLWKNTPAKAYAIVEQGKIKQIVVTEPGAGYSTPPRATVKGMDSLALKVSLDFGTDLSKNGSVASVEIEPLQAENESDE